MDSIDLAYIAGFFDGEGDCQISYPKNRLGNRNQQLRARITQNNREVLDWIKDSYGFGNVVVKRENGGTCNQCHALQFSCRTARKFLTSIEPFLKVKKEHVASVLDTMGREALD